MQLYAIITAAGSSSRMGLSQPKPLLNIGGKPLLAHTLSAFAKLSFEKIIVTAPAQYLQDFAVITDKFPNVDIISGGATRAASIYNGLKLLPQEGIVLVHDGARPFITPDLLTRVISAAQKDGAAIPVIPVTDTIKQIDDNGFVTATLPRHQLCRVQTPQGFSLDILQKAYQSSLSLLEDPLSVTDDASLVEKIGIRIATVSGDEKNIKITTPEDLRIAEIYSKN